MKHKKRINPDNFVEYLENVILNWENWKTHHYYLIQAISNLIQDYKQTKRELEILQVKFNNITEIINK
jgi:hypothetical protein